MTLELLGRSLSDLASEIPGATRVFHQHRLDFCCGGHVSLREAAERRSVDTAGLVQALKQLQEQARENGEDWRQVPVPQLIAHLVQRYHEVHREQLPELIRLARRVEVRHQDHPHCPAGLADVLESLQQELESHMHKEERVLFPMLTHGSDSMAQSPIAVMRLEHEQHGESLEDVLELTQDLQLPQDACTTWRALYGGLEQFRQDLMEHIHLENNILFKNSTERVHGGGHA
ncbi:iron-sulfur cluster repair protein YtfE [Alcaligenes sp. WGS1538]|uniref:iron-sulfur cluster repair protein YtfE n=1 Tax=Alcaligenes sp. WGS1538 TaxID=3366811 RepID=UPI00372D229F